MKHTLTLLILTAGLTSLTAFAEQSKEQAKACVSIGDDAKRLACYDDWAATAFNSKVATTGEDSNSQVTIENENSAKTDSEPAASLPSTLGGGKFDKTEKVIESNRGKVVSCKQSYDKRWFFIFDNGQVWKQTDRRQRFFKDCDFFVTLTEDGFGYKMFIEGKKTKIRVKRTK